MDKKIIITSIIAFIIAVIPCCGQQNKMKGVSHGKEKAWEGDKDPGTIKELHLTILENGEETTDIEMKQVDRFYEARYLKDGKRHYETIEPRDLEMLKFITAPIYEKQDYYQDYKSKKGPKGLEFHLGTKYDNAVFLLNGEGLDPLSFDIVNAVIIFFDKVFEFNQPDKPFPQGKLTLFTYTHKGTMRPGGPEWRVESKPDGTYDVTYTNDSMVMEGKEAEVKKKNFPGEVGEKLAGFLKSGKAQNYKSDYNNPGVMDGSSWALYAKFDGGKDISSRGYMNGPRDRSAIDNTLKYLEELMGVEM